ncbi:LysM peptidoglycan-binding domain-containing protein [Cytobacillus sp. FJAT-54145]|uniref:LysM peptidoglycan-binding domain-containing protein n=1 Tax=Cytobacillus spartinae TaxID=3299023 RepID=A0ABW6K5E0_9BACI
MAIHVVKRGDTLWAISKLYNTSIQTIVQVNGLESINQLVPGVALYIPDEVVTNRLYSVKPGDTLWRISVQFNTNISAIIAANPGLDPNRLFIGQSINIPSPTRLEVATLGFVLPYYPQTVLANIEQLAGNLTYLAIVSYTMTDQGYAYVLLEDREIVARSKELNISPLLMIRNYRNGDFSAELIGKVLENPTYRRNLILSLVNLARQRGYDGVSIDFEFIPPARRNDFNTFLADLKRELGNLILHVNVHAKTQDIPTNRIIGAYDYRTIGAIADIVAVMTIDYGYPTGPPDPVAPYWWIEEVIRYSLTEINPRKLQISLPLYGYEKIVPPTSTGIYTTKSFSVLAAQNLAISTGVSIQFDTRAASPWYRYWSNSTEHVIWFEDIRSYSEKLKLIDYYQLLGVTFWQLSLPSPQLWTYMSKNINPIKIRK